MATPHRPEIALCVDFPRHGFSRIDVPYNALWPVDQPLRPRYENPATLAKEKALIERVAPRWKCIAKKNPTWYRVDFSLIRGGSVAAFAEAKCRDIRSDDYRTFFISLEKYMSLQQATEITGLKSLILVEWLDKTGFVTVPCEYSDIRMGGRTDRNDPDDIEPMVHIPIGLFKML